MKSKNFYITTPIYYPSAKPHMGHAYSSIIADFFARFKRMQGFNVFYLTGTDEHGQKIERAAKENGKEPLAFCDEISQTFKDLTQTLNLSNNDFIRTTEERHKKSAKNIWNILEKKGEIYLSKYSGWYSVSDEAFYTDDEIEEVNGFKQCKISGSKVEWVEEESYFFKSGKKICYYTRISMSHMRFCRWIINWRSNIKIFIHSIILSQFLKIKTLHLG